MSVEFHDYSMQVKAALDEKAAQFLEEAAIELKTAAQKNSRVDTGHLKELWNYVINGNAAIIGNPLENAIWEEFGTGEYAVGGKGHGGGYWVYVKGSRGGGKEHGKRYTLQKAKQIVAMMRAEGLDAYYTSGKRPNHTLQRAYQSAKGKIINRAKQIFGELGG